MFAKFLRKPFPPGPSLSYLTGVQLRHFDESVKNGEISIYRRGKCERCDRAVPKSMAFCSQECYEKAARDTKKKRKGA